MDGEPIVNWLCREPLNYWRLKWTSNVPQAVCLADGAIDVYGQVLMKLNTLHNQGRCCGDLLGARIHGGQVVIAEIDPADLRHGILQDLYAFLALVLAVEDIVYKSTGILSSWSSAKFVDLYRALPAQSSSVDEVRHFSFFIRNNPHFMDEKAKFLFHRKVLTLYESNLLVFKNVVKMRGLKGWVNWISNPDLLAVKNFTLPNGVNPVNERVYREDSGSIHLFRNAVGHVRANKAMTKSPDFIEDYTVIRMLEDDLPMAIPTWFESLFLDLGSFHPSPTCRYLCNNGSLKQFLERPISFCAWA